jgi:hypothetical protein
MSGIVLIPTTVVPPLCANFDIDGYDHVQVDLSDHEVATARSVSAGILLCIPINIQYRVCISYCIIA